MTQSRSAAEQTVGCNRSEHRLHRRLFLKGLSGTGAVSLMSWKGLLTFPGFAEQARREQKHCILLWLCGAPSQFETWDPKPGTQFGGPFASIPTRLPGVRFSELMPHCAEIADRLSIVRSMKTSASEHFEGISLLNRGAEPRPPFTRPTLGAVLGAQLGQLDNPIPNFVLIDPNGYGNEFQRFKAGDWAGWLGADTAPLRVGGEYTVSHINRVADLTAEDHEDRESLRRFLSKRFENERKSQAAASQNSAFQRVQGLMSCAHLFDINNIPETERQRYGPGTFAQHTLLARHLVENGAPFVMVANGMPWDSHTMNHQMHQMLVPELDHTIMRLLGDLEDRGLLDSTLVVIMGEFGRTPWLNANRGRDHYSDAWSLALAGCGIRRGVVVGETDPEGVSVVSQPLNEMNLFATFFSALGIDPYAEYKLPGLPVFHRVEERAEPVREVLT